MTEKDIHNKIFIVRKDITLSKITLHPRNTYAVGLSLQNDKVIELEGGGAGKLHNFTEDNEVELPLEDIKILMNSELVFPEDILKQCK